MEKLKQIGGKAIDYVIKKWNGDLFEKGMVVFCATLFIIIVVGLLS